MNAPIPFEKHRFRPAAPFYLQGRPAYAGDLIRRIVQLCALDRSARVMDLGCGPGQLARALAPFVAEVVAVDPEPEMLKIAARGAADARIVNIRFIEASAQDIGPAWGRFDLAVIGRAFHWMDRSQTLRLLDQVILPGGAVALLGTDHPEVADNAWRALFNGVIDRYGASDSARAHRKSPGWQSHGAVLLLSAFCRIERISVWERRRTPLKNFVDRARSLSSVAAKAGELAGDIADELRAVLAPYAAKGEIAEVVESKATIAWRAAT
jgi:SAM-dependent methyltransferase